MKASKNYKWNISPWPGEFNTSARGTVKSVSANGIITKSCNIATSISTQRQSMLDITLMAVGTDVAYHERSETFAANVRYELNTNVNWHAAGKPEIGKL